MRIGFFIAKKQALDEWTVFQFDLSCHLLHIEDCLVLVKFVIDLEFVEQLEDLLAVGGGALAHDGII